MWMSKVFSKLTRQGEFLRTRQIGKLFKTHTYLNDRISGYKYALPDNELVVPYQANRCSSTKESLNEPYSIK